MTERVAYLVFGAGFGAGAVEGLAGGVGFVGCAAGWGSPKNVLIFAGRLSNALAAR